MGIYGGEAASPIPRMLGIAQRSGRIHEPHPGQDQAGNRSRRQRAAGLERRGALGRLVGKGPEGQGLLVEQVHVPWTARGSKGKPLYPRWRNWQRHHFVEDVGLFNKIRARRKARAARERTGPERRPENGK